jgi:hypothetical protein
VEHQPLVRPSTVPLGAERLPSQCGGGVTTITGSGSRPAAEVVVPAGTPVTIALTGPLSVSAS